MTAIKLLIPSSSRRLVDLTALRGWFRNEDGDCALRVSDRPDGGWLVTVPTEVSGVAWTPWGSSVDDAVATPTCSLQPRDEPYLLATELARGACSRLRSLLGPGESATSPDAAEARALLRRAALSKTDCESAQAAASESLAQFRLLHHKALLERARRRVVDGRPAVVFVRAGEAAPEFIRGRRLHWAWSDVQPKPGAWNWQGVDSLVGALDGDCRLAAGPLFSASAAASPSWGNALSSAELVEAGTNYLAELIERRAGEGIRWVLAGDSPADGEMRLSEEERAHAAMAILPEVRAVSESADLCLRFADPWDDQLREGARISQSYLADLLLRSDAGLSSIELAVRFGWDRGFSKPRDAAAIFATVSRWDELGSPLHVIWQAPRGGDVGTVAPSTDAAIDWCAASLAAGAESVTLDWDLGDQFDWRRFGESLGLTERSTPS